MRHLHHGAGGFQCRDVVAIRTEQRARMPTEDKSKCHETDFRKHDHRASIGNYPSIKTRNSRWESSIPKYRT